MSDQDNTISRDIADIKVSMAVIVEKIGNMNERLEVINHNSGELAQRLAVLERGSQRTTDYKEFVVKLFAVAAAIAGVAGSLAYVLILLGVKP
jgi:hypothetical protein